MVKRIFSRLNIVIKVSLILYTEKFKNFGRNKPVT